MANPRINPTNAQQANTPSMNAGRQINTRSNPGQTARSVGQMSSYGVARSGMNQLREGDVIRGEVSDLRNNEITITLENNTLVKGQITDSSSLSIGQTAAFRMDTVSPSGLVMEAIDGSYTETELTLINKALEEAGLPSTPRNQSAVKALMDNLLPINKQSIQHLMQQAYDYGTEDMETLCIMNRQHLDINRDSVTQFSAYRNQQYQLINKIQTFSQQLPELLGALAENGPSGAVAAFGERLIGIALSGTAASEQTSVPESALTISNLTSSDLEAFKELLANTPLNDTQLQQLQNGTLSQRDALILLRDAAATGTLHLPADCSQAEMTAKLQEISLALGLSDADASFLGDGTVSGQPTLSADIPLDAASAQNPEGQNIPEQDMTGQTTPGEDNSIPAPSPENPSPRNLAGKFFQNLSDAAKISLHNLNQNLNQMLASQAEGSISVTHTPPVMDRMLTSVTAAGRETEALFTYLSAQSRTELANNLSALPLSPSLGERIRSGEATTREVLTAIRDMIPHSDSAQMAQLFQTEAFQKLFTQSMLGSFTITPKQLSKDGELHSFYEKLESKMDSFERLINSTLSGSDSQELSQQAHNMKSNVDFMKALNETFSYMQLPLKLQNQNTHGDLYVYTQKEKLKNNPDKVSLLLHLEMDHLGTMNIRLEKDHQNIDARFSMDNTDSIRLIERNTHMLQDALNEKGYTCHIQVQPEESQENPIDDFLKTKVSTSSIKEMKRFSFDIRA